MTARLPGRSAAFAPSRTQRVGTICVVILLHVAVFVYRGAAPSLQPSQVVHVAAERSSISVVFAPMPKPSTSPGRAADRALPRSATAAPPVARPSPLQPALAEALPTAQTSPVSTPALPHDAQAEHAQSRSEPGAAPAPNAEPDSDADYSRNPPPAYPPASRRSHEEGRVLLAVLVSIDGAVKEVSVEVSSGYRRLDEAAIEAVRQWVFLPAKRGGVAIAARIRVPVNFVLSP